MSKPIIRVVSAAICQRGRYLITQRNEWAVLPLLWEFPGGRVQDSENSEEALKRELIYRLGILVQVQELMSVVEREYENYIIHLQLYRCSLGEQAPRPLGVRALRWVKSEEFDDYEFAPADQKAMDALLNDDSHLS